MILRKREETANGTRKHWIALYGELDWKKVYGPIVRQTTELINACSKVFVSEVLISSRSFWKQERLESEM